MSKVLILDSAPVGLITNPKATPLAVQCQEWFYTLNLENNLAIALLSHVEDTEEEEKMRSHGEDFGGDRFFERTAETQRTQRKKRAIAW
jgi:hypothetical protein